MEELGGHLAIGAIQRSAQAMLMSRRSVYENYLMRLPAGWVPNNSKTSGQHQIGTLALVYSLAEDPAGTQWQFYDSSYADSTSTVATGWQDYLLRAVPSVAGSMDRPCLANSLYQFSDAGLYPSSTHRSHLVRNRKPIRCNNPSIVSTGFVPASP